MEDPIAYDLHHPPNLQNDVVLGGLDVPPIDDQFDLDHLDVDVDDPFNVDFDFTFDDLSFADTLLSDPNLDVASPGRVVPQNPSSDYINHDNNNNVIDIISCDDDYVNVDGDQVRVFECSSPEDNHHRPISSQESNFGDKLSCNSSNSGVYSGNCSDRDVSSSLINNNNSNASDCNSDGAELERKVKVEDISAGNKSSSSKNDVKCVPKRKKEGETVNDEIRTSKFRKAEPAVVRNSESEEFSLGGGDDDDKRKARLMRNRESAQLSRQRKKQYVEELEDKVRAMHSTITDLNSKISYMMAENATLRQQMCAGAGAGAGAGVAPPVPGMGMYPPMAPMPYPWMPYAPYMVKPQGSHVPLVPIPRLKPQQPAPAPKVKKSSEKKSGGKTKKVASVSLLGFFFFLVLFGGFVPMVNVRYGGVGDGYGGIKKGTVFMVDSHLDRKVHVDEKFGHGRVLQQMNSTDRGNSSEPLVASLYVPRNDKLVKIDGNLIIHSVLASEKAMSSNTGEAAKAREVTSLAIHGSYPPYPLPGPGSNSWRHPHLDRNQNARPRALVSGSSDDFTPIGSDGKLQQWFREGLAGPMLSSEMCTEVFQFDISPTPGSIVPATSMNNITAKDRQNSTSQNKPKNRRILNGHAIPLNDHTLNITEDHVLPHEKNDGLQSNKSRSPMVVSVLVDPREVGDGDGEGVIGSKTLSRIFVVVLIDSVKYVTYSCMLPFMGSGSHLVTT